MVKIQTSAYNEISSLFEVQGGAGSWVPPAQPLFSIKLALEGWELFLFLYNSGGFSQLDSDVHHTLKPYAGHWAAHLYVNTSMCLALRDLQPIPIQLCLVLQLPLGAERKMILDSCHQMCWDPQGAFMKSHSVLYQEETPVGCSLVSSHKNFVRARIGCKGCPRIMGYWMHADSKSCSKFHATFANMAN